MEPPSAMIGFWRFEGQNLHMLTEPSPAPGHLTEFVESLDGILKCESRYLFVRRVYMCFSVRVIFSVILVIDIC